MHEIAQFLNQLTLLHAALVLLLIVCATVLARVIFLNKITPSVTEIPACKCGGTCSSTSSVSSTGVPISTRRALYVDLGNATKEEIATAIDNIKAEFEKPIEARKPRKPRQPRAKKTDTTAEEVVLKSVL